LIYHQKHRLKFLVFHNHFDNLKEFLDTYINFYCAMLSHESLDYLMSIKYEQEYLNKNLKKESLFKDSVSLNCKISNF